MGNLFLSFSIAIGGAVSLVTLSKVFDLEMYTNRIFPLIPILYAIVYEVLERRKAGRAKPIPPTRAGEEMKAGARALIRNITAGRIVTDVGVSFAIKYSVEFLLVALFVYTSDRPFSFYYGPFGLETVGTFLRGEHPWLSSGSGDVLVLALIALAMSFGTGLWIGYTTNGNAILEGVLAGAVVTLISSMTNLLVLYRTIEAMTVQLAGKMGYVTNAGFVVVIGVQVLLFGLWSGIARKAREERELRASIKKSVKKLKKK